MGYRGLSLGAFLDITSFDPKAWWAARERCGELEGVDHLEVWLEYVPRTRKEFSMLKSLLAGQEHVVHAPFIGLSLASPWVELANASYRRLVEVLEMCDGLGSRVLTVHGGRFPFFELQRAGLERVASRMNSLMNEGSKTVIAIENMPKRSGTVREAVSNVDEHFGQLREMCPGLMLTFDVGHAVQNGEDPIGIITSYDEAIVNVHLHDAIADGEAHLEIGCGDLDVGKLLRVFQDIDYTGYLGLETLGEEATERSWRRLIQELGVSDVESKVRHRGQVSGIG